MKQKDFVFNLCILLFLNLLIKPFWILGIDIGVQNQVGAVDFGLYFAVFNFSFMFSILLDMGTTNFNNRNIARNSQLLDKHLSSIIVLRLLLAAGYFVIVFVFALIIGYRGRMLHLLFWTSINQFLNTFILYLRSNVSALMMFKTDSVLSVLDRMLMILFCGVLLWGNITHKPFRIEWFVYCQTLAYTLAALTALSIVLYKSHLRKLSWNSAFLLMILKKSLPYALLSLLMVSYNRIDSVMIERMLPGNIGAAQAGIYASAFRLLDALVMIAYLFSVILLPLFSKMIKKRENIEPIVRTSFSLLFLFSISAVVILLNLKEPILSLLYRKHVFESMQVFSLLIPCIIPISFMYIFGTLLTANGSMRRLNITAAIGIVVNIAVNLILIPRMQARGAAIASLSTQSVVSLLQWIIAMKELRVPFKTLPWLSCIIFSIFFIPAVPLFIKHIDIPTIWMLALLCSYAILIAFTSRLLDFKGMIAMLKTPFEKKIEKDDTEPSTLSK